MKPHQKGLLVSLALYLVSLFCPAFRLEEGNSGFLLGFVCLLFGFEKLAWYANPIFFAGVAFYARRKFAVALVLAGGAIAVAMATLQIREMPMNEAGTKSAVLGPGLGFYLWVASMAVLLVSSAFAIVRSRKGPPAEASGRDSGDDES